VYNENEYFTEISMKPSKIALNVVSKVATPHNNVLMKALEDSGFFTLKLYYSLKTMPQYAFNEDIVYDVSKPIIIGERNIYWKLVWSGLFHPKEDFLFIGWPNYTAILLLFLFRIFRRRFFFWSDCPDETLHYRFPLSSIRSLLYNTVKICAHKIFLVGDRTIQKFIHLGYKKNKLVNLPIFIETDKCKSDLIKGMKSIRQRYSITEKSILFISGSRLNKSKGFDILIYAINKVRLEVSSPFKLIIIGQGDQEIQLKQLVNDLKLKDYIYFEKWLQPQDFKSLIACSDVYIHPARFDAFGGGTLQAMALGIPVIGSEGAGSAIERIHHGINGYIFPVENINDLASYMIKLINNPELIKCMGRKARETAIEWPVERGVNIIYNNIIN
jgi:glycosyltransferase involved in cell wall biosynthesis